MSSFLIYWVWVVEHGTWNNTPLIKSVKWARPQAKTGLARKACRYVTKLNEKVYEKFKIIVKIIDESNMKNYLLNLQYYFN